MTSLTDLQAAATAYAVSVGYTPPPPVVPQPSANPSGIPMPSSEPVGWTRILAEDFGVPVPLGAWKSDPGGNAGKSISSQYPQWGAYPYPWTGTPTSGVYHPELSLSVHDGLLDRYLKAGSPHLIAAVLPNLGGTRMSLRIVHCSLYPVLPGFHVSELLWPNDNTWPRDGEIDWPEGDLTAASHTSGFMHNQGGTSGGDQVQYAPTYPLCDGHYHVYGMEWRAGKSMRMWRDNDPGITWTSRVPSTAMHYVMQLGVSFAGPPAAGVQGHVLTDWVTIAA